VHKADTREQEPFLARALGAAGAGALAGVAIGFAEWSLGETSRTPGAAAWIVSFFVVASGISSMLAAGLAAMPGRWMQIDPLWLWGWGWAGAYVALLVNITLLPRQSFTSLPSIGLTTVSLVATGFAVRILTASTRRLRSIGSSRLARVSGGVTLAAGLALFVAISVLQPRPDLTAHHHRRDHGQLNALVILIDTLRPDHLGSYGYGRPVSPNLDRLAATGVRFESAWSSSSWTVPAVASLFSGLPLSRHGATAIDRPFTTGPTLAAEARAAGMVTAGFSANYLVSELYGFDRGFDLFVSERSGLVHPVLALTSGTTPGRLLRRLADLDRMAASRALTWLDAHRDDHFFLYLHLYAPHRPYDPPAAWRERFVDAGYNGTVYQGAERGGTLPPEALRNVLERYDAEIAHADALTGEVLDRLDELGLEDSTLVVVLSDHGEAFGEHGRWGHGQSLYVDETRIPLIARIPGGAVGYVAAEPVSLIDLHATLREVLVAGAAPEAGTFSLLPALMSKAAVSPHPVISELLADSNSDHPESFDAVVMGNLRLVRNISTENLEVFDRIRDPAESRPLSDMESVAVLLPHLTEGWWTGGLAGAAVRLELTEEDRRRLRALGYVR